MRLRRLFLAAGLAGFVLFSTSCNKQTATPNQAATPKGALSTVIIQLSAVAGSCQQAQPGTAPITSIGIDQGQQIEYETPNSVPFEVQFPSGASPCSSTTFSSANGQPVYTGACQGGNGSYPYSKMTINGTQCTLAPGMGVHIPH